MSCRAWLSSASVLCAFAAAVTATDARGFAEEQTDPTTKATVSTHHLYLTRALAVCAGFEYAEGVVDPVLAANGPNAPPAVLPPDRAGAAEVIAFNDEMTDVGTICMSGGAPCTGNSCVCDSGAATWTNCTPGSISKQQVEGDPSSCPGGASSAPQLVFPVIASTGTDAGVSTTGSNNPGAWQPQAGCFSQRFSPWSPMYHFPQEEDLEANRKFAMGEAKQLRGRAAYGRGPAGSNMWSGTCYQRPEGAVPASAIKAGTLAAFGMYLHSLGDHNSHKMCRDQWKSTDKPTWYFHTLGPQVLYCGFNDHAFEYGCADSTARAGFLQGTVRGAEQVFDALLQRAARDGKTPRISSLDEHGQWLRRQLQRYTTLYQPSVLAGQNASGPVKAVQQGSAQCRTQFAWQLLQACVANAAAAPDACLPDVAVSDSVCPVAGKVGSCPGGEKRFPIVPACKGGAAGKKKAP